MIKEPWKLIYTASLVLLGLLIVVSSYGFFLPKAEYTKIQRMQLLEEENERIIQFYIVNLENKDMNYIIKIDVDGTNYTDLIHVKKNGSFSYIQHIYKNHPAKEVYISISREGENIPFEETTYQLV
jgi:hypothetical protein